jgi:hypothetical protein
MKGRVKIIIAILAVITALVVICSLTKSNSQEEVIIKVKAERSV